MKHVEMKDLILVYEDLRGEEKAMADRHLEECSTCRHLLDDLQKVEKVDVGWGDLPADPSDENLNPVGHLNTQEQAEAHLSRQQLLDTVHGESVVVGTDSPWWRAHSGLVGMALAACLALVLWSPWQTSPSDLILGFRITSQSVVRGAVSDLDVGDSFVMRFTMGADGWPVVVRIVDGQKAELIFPTERATSFRLAAHRAVVLPPPGSGTSWCFDEGAVYLLAVSQTKQPVVEQLNALLETVALSNNMSSVVGKHLQEEFGNCKVLGPNK